MCSAPRVIIRIKKFLDALKSDWYQAGLACGKCQGCKNREAGKIGTGCDHAYIHKFRATCLTKLSRNGVSAFQIQTIAGHRDPSTTRRYVQDADAATMQAVMDRIFA